MQEHQYLTGRARAKAFVAEAFGPPSALFLGTPISRLAMRETGTRRPFSDTLSGDGSAGPHCNRQSRSQRIAIPSSRPQKNAERPVRPRRPRAARDSISTRRGGACLRPRSQHLAAAIVTPAEKRGTSRLSPFPEVSDTDLSLWLAVFGSGLAIILFAGMAWVLVDIANKIDLLETPTLANKPVSERGFGR
jgi:hypothetical protein